MMEGPCADSEEKHEPAGGVDTELVDSLKALDPKGPIREADIDLDRDRKTGAIRALLASTESEGLIYAGAAFIALGCDERKALFAELERLTTSWAAFKSSRLTDVKWCQPKLKVRVKDLACGNQLRHATVRGLSQ
jgi:hypothetical protein